MSGLRMLYVHVVDLFPGREETKSVAGLPIECVHHDDRKTSLSYLFLCFLFCDNLMRRETNRQTVVTLCMHMYTK